MIGLPTEEERMSKELACGAVVPGCDAVFRGESEDEVLAQVPEHARDAHGMEEVPPAVVDRARAAIRDVRA